MWQAVYVDGTCVTQSHKIQPMELLELAEKYNFYFSDVVDAEAKSDDGERAVDYGAFPSTQSDLKNYYFA